MKIILVATLLLSGISIKGMNLKDIHEELGVSPYQEIVSLPVQKQRMDKQNESQEEMPTWGESLGQFILTRDQLVADFQNEDSKDMQSVRNIMFLQAIELIELAKQVRQLAHIPLDEEWEPYGEFLPDQIADFLSMQIKPQLKFKLLKKEFKPVPKDWANEIIEVKILAAMVDNQIRRLKFIVNNKLGSTRDALTKARRSRSPAGKEIDQKEKFLTMVLDHINNIENGSVSPKKINENIQKFAEHLLSLTADKLPKIDNTTLSELEETYRNYASVLRGYLWGS